MTFLLKYGPDGLHGRSATAERLSAIHFTEGTASRGFPEWIHTAMGRFAARRRVLAAEERFSLLSEHLRRDIGLPRR